MVNHQEDIEQVLGHRHDNGADYWATEDRRLGVGSPFSTFESLQQLLDVQHEDGGWRCNRVAMGRSADTDASNPGVTLFALDALRFTDQPEHNPALDRAADSLLEHWTIRRPLRPCTFGIGTLFMQVEYPFLRYNLFSYVYVLSFYQRARRDERFQEAAEELHGKLDDAGRLIVERPNRSLAGLEAFAKGKESEPATRRYLEIVRNLGG